MKPTGTWLLAGIMVAFCAVGNARIIYSNDFAGGAAVDINGMAPTVANSLAGGTNVAVWEDALGTQDTNSSGAVFWEANGTVPGTPDSLLLPFAPQAGHVYTLTASLTFSGSQGYWVGLGFAQHYTHTAAYGHGRFSDDAVYGYDWAILTESTGNVQDFGGAGGQHQLISQNGFFPANTPATHSVKILLDTTNPQWTMIAYVDGVQAGANYTYAANPPIAAVGITETGLMTDRSTIRWNSFALSVASLEITQQPVSAAIEEGSAFTNTVVVSSDGPLFYQWYNNGVPITDATNASLIFNPVLLSDAGTNYYVIATNTYGAVTSAVTSLIVLTNQTTNTTSQLTSPDGSLVLTFAVSNFDGSAGCPVYSVARNGRTLIAASKLGLTFDSGGLLQNYLTILSESNSLHDSNWQPVYGETSSIRDHYNQLAVSLRELVPPYRILQLTFRAYNEGAAFCYTIPSQAGFADVTNLTEQTEFRFDADYTAWATYAAQGIYSQTNISGIANGCERPLTVELATNQYLALGEAGLVDYSRMKFAPLSGKAYSLVGILDGPVSHSLPLTTPWRFVMAADSPGRLLENNFLVLDLNDSCALTNISWIDPGKVIRDVTDSTQGGMACVDFAAKHNIQYVEFDAGWYGNENTSLTATNAVSGLNLPAVISHAASNNVGVILYVNWLAMTNELDLLPPLYHSWGVKGIKYGFVSVGSQQDTEIVNEAARICASNQIMMEVHDEFRPSGYTRTYPNFMTVEGILGDEGTPTTSQDMTELFSRLLVGGADHTVCYFQSRVTNNWSYAYQLAKAVCFYSPWQYIYWYDRPTNSPSYLNTNVSSILEVPEMEFWNYMPAVWDETRVLQGGIGQYAIVARRTGTQWFIGAMNADTTRTFNVPLDFLTPGRKYVANVYSQDSSVPTFTHVRIDRIVVDSTSTLTMTLGASRGEAIRLLPADPPGIQSLSPHAGGGFELTIAGAAGQPYSLWASPDLAQPATNWMLLSSGLITNSPLQWVDPLVQAQRFYRCSTP